MGFLLLALVSCCHALDLAAYVIPSCSSPAGRNRVVFPMGGNQFVVQKSDDSSGYEVWSVDSNWLYILRDTTWAWENPRGQWCDTVCGNQNGGDSPCVNRWRGQKANYAFTSYRNLQNKEGAQWFRRFVSNGDTFTTTFVVAAMAYSSCSDCQCNLAGSSSHSVRVNHYNSWNGLNDVVQMSVTGGAGTGETYFYAKGQGWVGFGGQPFSNRNSAVPKLFCGNYAAGNICAALGNRSIP